MLEIKQFAFGPFGVDTYILYDPETLEAIVVDPGMVDPGEYRIFDDFIQSHNLKLTQIVNTHLHLDHCFGDNYVRNKYGVQVNAHTADAPLGEALKNQCALFGICGPDDTPVKIDVPLHDGDSIHVGKYTLKVIHVPGHSPGGIALYCKDGNFAIVGDSLFRGSIGRTDLPGGDYNTLVNAVNDRLMSLPDSTLVLSGHDMSTTIGRERQSNPYIRH